MSIYIRKNIQNLTEPQLVDLRNAYKQMMQIQDNRGYNYLAGLHGIPGFWCWHHQRSLRTILRARLFLPWHRAYLYWFEQFAQDQVLGTTIPFWDWSIDQDLPKAFSDKTTNAEDNPLYKGHIYAPTANPPLDEDTNRSEIHDFDLPNVSDVSNALSESDFDYFNDSLENLHDQVHGWVGGSMGQIPTAAYDPIFWSHHSMVDRLWYIWQNRWGKEKGLEHMLDVVLAPFNLKVKDVINIYDLGYNYAGTAVSTSATSEA